MTSDALDIAKSRQQAVASLLELTGAKQNTSPRTYARSQSTRAIYAGVYDLSAPDLVLLNSDELRESCFRNAAAIYYAPSLRRCIRASDIEMVIEAIGANAMQLALEADAAEDDDTRQCPHIYAGERLAEQLRHVMSRYQSFWFACLPEALQHEHFKGQSLISDGDNAPDKDPTDMPPALARCLLAEITRQTGMEDF